MRRRLEYAAVRLLTLVLGNLPRPLSRACGNAIAMAAYALYQRLRRVGMRNLELAFPEKTRAERRQILRRLYLHLGRQLADFCRFPKLTKKNISQVITYEGFENFENAAAAGKGILFLTGHLGAWELSSFAHSLYGHPMHIVARGLDNPLVDELVTRYRTLHGNQIFDKDDYARGLLAALRNRDTIGILMDTNMTPPQGIFVDFFGIPACTASGLARVAWHSGAAVLPGFALWDEAARKYRLHFGKSLELVRTGNTESDVAANTALFNRVLEEYIRRYPDQWLWVHRRWKTRPPGEPPLY
jgi:KDO2-lipid IV(A) lauroyltransferase